MIGQGSKLMQKSSCNFATRCKNLVTILQNLVAKPKETAENGELLEEATWQLN